MAIRVEIKRKLNALELVSVNDDAIDTAASDIAEYKKTGDMAKLKFLDGKQPTIFLMNFELKGKEAEAVKNAIIGGKDDEGQPQVTLGSWSFKVVKLTLKDIKNPTDLPAECALKLKKDERGYVHEDTLSELDKLGLIDELFGFFTALAMRAEKAAAKN